MPGQLRFRLLSHGVAVGATLASLAVRWPLWPVLGNAVPHMTFFPAVAVAAYVGGLWPGLLATILSAAAANVFLTDLPAFRSDNVNDGAALMLFLLVGTIISALCESLHRARHRLVAEERRRSERALREEQLRHEKEVAEAANRAKGEFLANVSHEIRTPMNAILGMTELTLDSRLTADQRRSLETVQSAADHLLRLIDDLLDAAKIEAGKMELDAAAFSLREVIEDVLRTLSVRADKKGLRLTGDLPAEVPDAVIGDAGRLRQILFNLAGNAIKFTERGEVALRLELVDGSPADLAVRIEVRDTGIGIPPDQHEKIFRDFEQVDASTTRRFGGTGLGLPIAVRLAELMRGSISVASQPGQGSTFTLTARLKRPATAEAPKPANLVPDSPTATARPTPLHVLVAEDNEFNSVLLEQLLLKRGHRVRLAGNGREAVALARESAFDLLLLDLHMPELDGFGVVRAIRECERSAGHHLPIIALTARARPEDRERCLAAGMDGFLSKPIQSSALWAEMERVVPTPRSGRDQARNLLDPKAVLAACDNDPVILAAIGSVFRANLPGHLAAARDALQNHDAAALREAAHRLGGMVSAFSTVAADVASGLEDHAAAGRLDEARPYVEQLDDMAAVLIPYTDRLSLETLRSRSEVSE